MPCCQRRQLNSQGEEWQNLFKHYDEDGDGYIPIDDLNKMVRESAREFELSKDQVDELLHNADHNADGQVDFTEFCLLMTRAKRMHMRRVMIYVGRSILPARLQSENSRYLLEYNCLPPPLFIVLISLAQLAWWLVDCLALMPNGHYGGRFKNGNITATGPINIESKLVLDPYKMHEAWRFLSYSFCHFGYVHIVSNLIMQLLLGIPLEIVHKCWRIGPLYTLGAMSGSLLFATVNNAEIRCVYLGGASGGVYALISAHIANIAMNWSEMEFNWVVALVFGVLVSFDFGWALYQRYGVGTETKTSYTAHIGGFIAGLLLGIILLRNLRKTKWERIVWWISMIVFALYVLVCANVILIMPKPTPENCS